MLDIGGKYRLHTIFFFCGGLLIGGMAYAIQGRLFGFENVSIVTIAAPFFVGAASGLAISFLITSLLKRLAAEREISSQLKAQITERELVEHSLRGSEERFRTLARDAPVGIFETDAEGKCVRANKTWCDIAGMTEQVALGDGWANAIHSEDRETVFQAWNTAAEHNTPFFLEYRFQRPDSGVSWVLGQASAIRNEQGGVAGYVGTITDITRRKALELQLQQSQKLEAIGQLTGGVAHDFNNLLAVISGNSELLEIKLGGDDESVDAINRAVERGAELTQRLLAFSRRQPLRPQVIDLGDLISGMSDLLARTLGETVQISTRLAPGLWYGSADPGQVENALLNLAINARGAMPDGGQLIIETGNVTLEDREIAEQNEVLPGKYVLLAVSDTGVGMGPEVLTHAFEPFFTTKEVGEGSGLGLSMVYGFARQSGGFVTIESEEGHGTTIKLYLPRSEKAPRSEATPGDPHIPLGQGEAILLVEDDPDVRDISVLMLEGLGYQVTDAANAAAAAEVLASGTPIDLALCDVVLPGGTSGPEFAAAARANHPDLKVIFMSGYSAEVSADNGFLGPDQVLLNKPFQRHQLARALHQELN